ncbi:MAG TPA: hypothetical protein VMJ32_01450 [Pirellulales bacterium]|nr:hypothetical protein [Pirellulales bacterium]
MNQQKKHKVRRNSESENMIVSRSRVAESTELSTNTDRELEECAVGIAAAGAKTIESMLEIWRLLKKVHDLLAKRGNGVFEKWVKEHCPFTPACARNYLRAERTFGSIDPKSLCGSFTLEAMYYLNREATPKPAFTAALRLCKKGKRVTLAEAKRIVAKYTLEEAEGGNSDESKGERETSEGNEASDTAEDSGTGDEQDADAGGDQDAEPTADGEQSSADDASAETADDQSDLAEFANEISTVIEVWTIAGRIDEPAKFANVLRGIADELDLGP